MAFSKPKIDFFLKPGLFQFSKLSETVEIGFTDLDLGGLCAKSG